MSRPSGIRVCCLQWGWKPTLRNTIIARAHIEKEDDKNTGKLLWISALLLLWNQICITIQREKDAIERVSADCQCV